MNEEKNEMELLKINYTNDRQTVSGRALHDFLEVKDRYTDWFKRMCAYGFSENLDFIGLSDFSEKPSGGRPGIDHQLTIPMAKEICMLQRTEKGKQARLYFLELEEQWNSPEAVMARAINIANIKLIEMQNKTIQLENKVLELQPAADFGELVGNSEDTILIRDYAKILANKGIRIGQKKLFSWLNEHGYIYRASTSYNQPWVPYKKYVDMGLFKVTETVFDTISHGTAINMVTHVTGKGQRYFYDKLKAG